jgi:carboxylesterase
MSPIQMLGAAGVAGAVALTRQLVTWHFERDVASRLPIGPDGIVVGADPVRLAASDSHAVLLLHGFNDTPQSVRPLADALHRAGWTVEVPLLAGHGRGLHAVHDGRAARWLADARSSYEALREQFDTVPVVGLSMGGALAALLAAEYPEMEALVLLAPYLGMPRGLQFKVALAWVAQAAMPYRRSGGGERSIHDPEASARSLGLGIVTARMLTELRTVAQAATGALAEIRAPTLYLQSVEDNRIPAEDAERHFKRIGAPVREQGWLAGCGHIITADYCKDEVARRVTAWLERHAGRPSGAPPYGGATLAT